MTSLFEDHLSLDAVVAFVDGEMGLTAFQRAAAHLAQCQACAAEVAEQNSARQQLRAAACPRIPSGLLDALRSIPVALPAAPPPAGVARDTATGRAVRSVRLPHEAPAPPGAARAPRPRGFRLGAGAIVAGLAVGAIAATALADRAPGPAGPANPPDSTQVSYPMLTPPVAVVVAARSTR